MDEDEEDHSLVEAEDGLEVFAHDLGLPVADGLGAPHHGVPVGAVAAVAAVPCTPGVAPKRHPRSAIALRCPYGTRTSRRLHQ